MLKDLTANRSFYGFRLPRGFYVGLLVRRYRFDTRTFLVVGETLIPLLQWKKGR